MSKMSVLDLKSMLALEKASALAAISAAQLAEDRADAMDYYLVHTSREELTLAAKWVAIIYWSSFNSGFSQQARLFSMDFRGGREAMDSRRYINAVSPVRYGALMIGSLVMFPLLFWAQCGHAQQNKLPKATGNTVPTLEALPHSALPPGSFEKWCGLSDKVLMQLPWGIDIYDGILQASPHTFPSAKLECGNDGKKLILDDDRFKWKSEKTGWLSEVDVPTGVPVRTLASYEKQLLLPAISISPDLKNVASNRPLTLASGVVDLKVIQVAGRPVRWSRDSSQFFVVSTAKKGGPGIAEIFNAQNQKVGWGTVPANFLFRDGWFAGAQALYLYFGSADDEFGSGLIWKCKIENWKCDQIATNVLDASAGGDGTLGIVRAVGKYSNTGEVETFPSRYVAEIRNGVSQVMARQTFESANRRSFRLAVAPSGKKAVLAWHIDDRICPPEKEKMSECRDGIIIDLPGENK